MASIRDPKIYEAADMSLGLISACLLMIEICIRGDNSGALTICVCPVAVFRVTDAREMQLVRRDENLWVESWPCRVLSRRSREYLSGGSVEFSSFWSESWCL